MFHSRLDWGVVANGPVAPADADSEKGEIVSKSAQSPNRDAGSGGPVLSARGWSKARAVSVPILASTAMTCAMGALLPPVPGLVMFTLGLVVAFALLFARMEPVVVRLVYGGVPLTAADQHVLGPVLAVLAPHGFGPPLVRIWLHPGSPSDGVIAVGRRSVLVSRGLMRAISSGEVGVERAAVLFAQAAGLVRGGATRLDLSIRFWTLPWVWMRYALVSAARGFGVIPLVRSMWGARWLLTVVAATQAMAGSRVVLAGLVVGIGVISYIWPRWVRAWQAECRALSGEAVAALYVPASPAGLALGRGDANGDPGLPSRTTAARRPHLSVVR